MSNKFNFTTLEMGFEATWPVKVNVPQDGGTVSVETFDVRFRLVGLEELTQLAQGEDPFAIIKAALVSVPGQAPLRDAEGKETAFLQQLLQPAWVRAGLMAALEEFSHGAAAKN